MQFGHFNFKSYFVADYGCNRFFPMVHAENVDRYDTAHNGFHLLRPLNEK